MALIRPPAVRPAATVAVCAPAGPADPYRLSRGIEVLSRRYKVVFDNDLLDPHSERQTFGYLAGPDERRAEELTDALTNPDVAAIFLARGGYGTMRLAESFDRALIAKHPKPIIGFSDATVLLHWWLDAGVVAVHGPVVTQMAQTESKDLEHLWRLLEDPQYRPTYHGRPANDPTDSPLAAPCGKAAPSKQKSAQIEGKLWGGNLTMISAKSGWSSPPSEPTIALFEDLAEAPYRLDRMITQLHLSGQLAAIEAAALGTFLPPAAPTTRPAARPPDDPPQPGRSKQDLARKVACRLAELGVPSVLEMPWGHVGKNLAVALGVQARIDLEEGTLTCLEGLVSRPS